MVFDLPRVAVVRKGTAVSSPSSGSDVILHRGHSLWQSLIHIQNSRSSPKRLGTFQKEKLLALISPNHGVSTLTHTALTLRNIAIFIS